MARPVLKWAGGKGKLLPQLLPLLPPDAAQRRYIEPFVGAGALFFQLAPERAVIRDANPELITVYTAVRGAVEELIEDLTLLAATHQDEHTYYAARERFNAGAMSLCERAALFIYLNRTCFNGLYRVNKAGDFNVPCGRYKNPRICDPEGLREASAALQGADIQVGDYTQIADLAEPGDLVYLDPPYAPLSSTSNFVAYTRGGFGSDSQTQLAELFRELDRRGCRLILSNSDTPELKALYKGFYIRQIQAPRAVGASAESRAPVGELVITNYETGETT